MITKSLYTFEFMVYAKNFSDRHGLNKYSVRDVNFAVIDEVSQKRALRVKDKCISDLKKMDELIKQGELIERQWKAIKYVVQDRERMIFVINEKLMAYNLSLNVEKV